MCGRYCVLPSTAHNSLSTATISTARNIDRAGIPRFAGLFLKLSRLRAMRSMYCGLSRSSAVETSLGTNVYQQLYAPGATLVTLARTYDCPILVQEARQGKPEGAE